MSRNCRIVMALLLTGLLVGCGDDDGNKPSGNTDPTACFTVTPTAGTAETEFQVDASCSSDDQDSLESLQVRWDWENDGTWDIGYWPAKTANQQHTTMGTKTIKLEVKDTSGLTWSTTRTVTVTGGGPVPGAMSLVPAGTFTMGHGEASCGGQQREVTLTHSFYLGQHEVTNQEYRDALQWAYDHGYVTATADSVNDNLDGSTALLVNLTHFDCHVSFSAGTFAVDSGKGSHPMVAVTWFGAAAHCDWLRSVRGCRWLTTMRHGSATLAILTGPPNTASRRMPSGSMRPSTTMSEAIPGGMRPRIAVARTTGLSAVLV